ncbi:hypothetical protein K6959_15790 [Bacillus aquiflavi]|uniref:elicitor-associated permease-like protein n=1 Tax=Bacillus aquiflavi TaxID=2672567 RepID=UPI001CA9E1A4|nr:elicitor-associated permease-like protein [Bacillus aquiflavi]UAC48029.1 hypothetical protein K6959_15790 [Bacillus aquiflavi]
MNFINYLSFKYKINRRNPKGSKKEKIAERIAIILLFLLITFTIFFIVRLLPQGIQENMNKYMVGFFAFLCLISFSTAVKKYYKEYFLSPEREILLIAPVKNSQIILSRFSIVAIEVIIINTMFLMPFAMANYLAGNISKEIVLITIPQIVAMSFFFSAITHIIFAIAYLISKGKGLKTVAYSLMTAASVGVIVIIVFLQGYKSLLFIQDKLIENLLYLLLQYPKYLMINNIKFIDVGLFTIFIALNTLCFIAAAYWITAYSYKKGLLTISSRDLEKSFYSLFVTNVIHKHIHTHFIKKDLLFLIRSPQLFSVYVSPILFTSVIEIRNQFASSGVLLTVLINIFTFVIITVTLHILMSDDATNSELLFTIPINTQELFKSRSKLLHILTFLNASIYLVTVCLLEAVRIEYIVFGILQIFILTYIASRILLARVIKRSQKNSSGYLFNGSIVRTILYYFFVWNIPLLIFFSILHEYLRRVLETGSLSRHATIMLIII